MSKKESPLSQDSSAVRAHVVDWLCDQLRETFEVPQSLNTSLSILEDFDKTEFQYVIDACMATCGFRPSEVDLREVLRQNSMQTFSDLASVLTMLFERRPKIDGLVHQLTLSNCATFTAPFWKLFLEIPAVRYNDQSVIECFIRSTHSVQSSAAFEKLLTSYNRELSQFSSKRLETSLLRSGYHFVQAKQDRWKIGDIIKVQKETDCDRFAQFAILTATGSRQSIEFKPSTAFPLKASLEGFRLFFLGDPETNITGIWTLSGAD